MGAALAHSLRELSPQFSLLLAEEGGLPNEEGATILAPGVWHADVPLGQSARAEETRALLGDALNVCGLLDLSTEAREGFPSVVEVWTPELAALIDPEVLPFARLDRRAGTYSAGSVTLADANAAIGSGAALMLNGRSGARQTAPPERDQYARGDRCPERDDHGGPPYRGGGRCRAVFGRGGAGAGHAAPHGLSADAEIGGGQHSKQSGAAARGPAAAAQRRRLHRGSAHSAPGPLGLRAHRRRTAPAGGWWACRWACAAKRWTRCWTGWTA